MFTRQMELAPSIVDLTSVWQSGCLLATSSFGTSLSDVLVLLKCPYSVKYVSDIIDIFHDLQIPIAVRKVPEFRFWTVFETS